MSPRQDKKELDLPGLPVDAVIHIHDCERRWEDMEKTHLPVLESLKTDRIRVVAIFCALVTVWGVISASVSSAVQAKIEQSKSEMMEAIRKGPK